MADIIHRENFAKGNYTFSAPEFINDGEDAIFVKFPDREVKYVPAHETCGWWQDGVCRKEEAEEYALKACEDESYARPWFVCSECGQRLRINWDGFGFYRHPDYCPNCGAKVGWIDEVE